MNHRRNPPGLQQTCAKEDFNNKMKKILKYLITFVLGSLVVLVVLFSKDTFYQTQTSTVFRDLSDAFFVSGVIMAGLGLLVFASNGGAFDMLSFGVMRFFSLFKRDLTKVKYRTFYDYRKAQQEKKRGFAFILIEGCVFLAVAALFLILYNNAV